MSHGLRGEASLGPRGGRGGHPDLLRGGRVAPPRLEKVRDMARRILHADGSVQRAKIRPLLLRAVTAIFPVVLAGILGSLATSPNISGWYAGLTKPGFTPPKWVFGPVWSVLYVLMAAALW